jgi:hypothetical protein
MDDWTSKQLPERLPFSKKRLPKKVIFSYIGDYLIIVQGRPFRAHNLLPSSTNKAIVFLC